MADEHDGTTDDDAPVDPTIRDRRQAQGAAGDLARMGIDPRSLGLTEPAAPQQPVRPRPSEPEDDLEPRAPVVYLRPQDGVAQRPAPPAAPVPADPEPVRPPSELEQQLSGAAAPAAPRQTSRLLKTVARGLVTPDAAVAVQGERQIVDAVRQRQTDRRIVTFVAGKGGVGCTTVAVGVGTAFMAMREDRSVVIDVQQGTPSLAAAFGVEGARSVASLVAETEATTPPVAPSGLGLVDGSGWDQALSRSDVVGVLDRLRADHTFNLLDVGDDAGEAGHAALARADQAVVVTGPGELGVAALRTALERVRQVNPEAAAVAVHVVVCPHEQSYREALRLTASSGTTSTSVVVVPPDPYLQDGHAYDPARVASTTREAFLRIAGAVALRSVRR
jgi:MinD-like ATPase involved in chromosome partitioning or flagellar assembly